MISVILEEVVMRCVIICVLVFFTQISIAENLNSLDTLSVSGQGFVDVKPDVVDLHFELSAKQMTLAEAKQKVDDLYRQTQAVLAQYEINDADIKLETIRSFPEYEWRSKKKIFKGHHVLRRLKVTVRNLDSYPNLLEALVNAEITEISHVLARIENESESKLQAMKKAVADAKQKAKFLGTEFDRELGKVLVINESGATGFNPVMQRSQMNKSFAQAISSSITAVPQENLGTQRIQVSINAVFKLN